jgi:hypothetical protein
MHRRIRHWSSQGFIYLGQVDEITLRAAVQPAVSPMRNDTPLSIKLEMDRKNIIQDFVMTQALTCPQRSPRSQPPPVTWILAYSISFCV